MQFRSADGAQAYLTTEAGGFKAMTLNDRERYITFSVPAIPGAVAQGLMLSPHNGYAVIRFTAGTYYYAVGQDVATSLAVSVESLRSAAKHLFRRVVAETTVGPAILT